MADFDADQGTTQERILVLGEGRLIGRRASLAPFAAHVRATRVS